MKQLSLFGTAAPVLVALQSKSAAPEPAKITVHRRCCACEGLVIDWHTPILSVAQMQAAGWTLLAPNVWATPGQQGCSRYCDLKKAAQRELCLIP